MPCSLGSIGTYQFNSNLPLLEETLGYPEDSIVDVWFNVEVLTSGENRPSWGYEPPEFEDLEDVNLLSIDVELADKTVHITDQNTIDMMRGFLPEEDQYYWDIVEEAA